MTDTIPLRIKELQLQLELAGATEVKIDRPSNPEGEWYIDFVCGGRQDCILWQHSRGYRLWSGFATAFGERPHAYVATAQEAVEYWKILRL